MGRRRVQNKGPRSIDIDILLFNNEIIDSKELTIPHPAMQQRRFVLEPLAEIAPDVVHPILRENDSGIARCAAGGATDEAHEAVDKLFRETAASRSTAR